MNQLLVRAIVEAAMFAELSGDDVIQPDAAVGFLEQLSSTLSELPTTDREAFLQHVAQLEIEERAAGRDERADFLKSLPEYFGLV